MSCVSTTQLSKNDPSWLQTNSAAFSLSGLKARLLYPTFHLGWAGWLIGAVLTIAAGVLRFWYLGHPHELIADESQYVQDGCCLWHVGAARSWGDDVEDV